MMFDRVRLYLKQDIYNHRETDSLFAEAVRHNIIYHRRRCKAYHILLRGQGFRNGDLKSVKDLAQVPFLTTLYLKRHPLFSKNLRWLPVKATSSGTGGVSSSVGFDMKTLLYAGIMTFRLAVRHKLLSVRPANYIVLGYEPNRANPTMISKTQLATTFFAPPRHRKYALVYGRDGYQVDFAGLKETLGRYARQNSPVRLVGFPSYAFFLLRQLKQENISCRLPAGSMVLLGGGWKEFYREKVDKEELYNLAGEVLGIPEENCREFFGAAEHPVLYCSCRNHHFHVPNYSRVIIRDVHTMLPVKNGEIGLVNLITPAADSMPLVSVMTDDLGILRDGADCGCGIGTPYLELAGRVGVREIRTCAVSAADFLRGYAGGRDENRGD